MVCWCVYTISLPFLFSLLTRNLAVLTALFLRPGWGCWLSFCLLSGSLRDLHGNLAVLTALFSGVPLASWISGRVSGGSLWFLLRGYHGTPCRSYFVGPGNLAVLTALFWAPALCHSWIHSCDILDYPGPLHLAVLGFTLVISLTILCPMHLAMLLHPCCDAWGYPVPLAPCHSWILFCDALNLSGPLYLAILVFSGVCVCFLCWRRVMSTFPFLEFFL